MIAEYSKPIDFYTLLDNKTGFLRKPDTKLIDSIRKYFKSSEFNIKDIDKIKKLLDKEYNDSILSQSMTLNTDSIPHPSRQKEISEIGYEVATRDYLIRIYMYDMRFGDKNVMCGEQVISISIAKTAIVITINSSFIDGEILHSSIEELEQRSLDFIKADLNGDLEYYEEDY